MIVKNLQPFNQYLKRQAEDKKTALRRGLKKLANTLLRESNKIVPVDYGPLKASGEVRETLDGYIVTYTESYALYVHEIKEAAHGAAFNRKYKKELAAGHTTGPFRHPRGPNQTYKFLEKAYRRLLPSFKRTLREDLKREAARRAARRSKK